MSTATLTINNVATADEGSYDVVITGLCSNVTSTAAVLAVDDNAVITTQPIAVTQCEGTTATFSVVATGTNLTYRWRKDGVPLSDAGDISGATTPTLSIATIATLMKDFMMSLSPDCVRQLPVKGFCLAVNDNVVITGQPANVAQCEGLSSYIQCDSQRDGLELPVAQGTESILSDGGDISGALTSTLTIR